MSANTKGQEKLRLTSVFVLCAVRVSNPGPAD